MPDFNRGEYQVTFKATPGATLAETKERALAVVRELRKLPDVDYTYTTIGEAGITRRGPTEGVVFVKLKSVEGQDVHQVLSDARRAVAVVPGLTYGFTEAGAFGQKPLQYSRPRARGRRARPPLAPAHAGDGEDPRPRRRRDEPREEQARAARPVRPRPRGRPRPQRRPRRDDAAGRGHRRGRDDDRGLGRRQPRRARAPARRPAPLRRRPPRPPRADGQGRRPRRQDPRAARRGRDGDAGERPLDDPPQGPPARGAPLGHELRAAASAR